MFYKSVRKDLDKEMYQFLHDHYRYYTMSSWNNLKSIANCVKIYKLEGLKFDPYEVLGALNDDEYYCINEAISEWNGQHPGAVVGFNGRSGGYLVLYSKYNNKDIFDNMENPADYDTYEDFKEAITERYGSMKTYRPALRERVRLVQDFDRLCDDLIEVANDVTAYKKECDIEEAERKARTKTFRATKSYEEYNYETHEDFRLHKLYMESKGYRLYEYDEEDLWASYNMSELIEDEIEDKENK